MQLQCNDTADVLQGYLTTRYAVVGSDQVLRTGTQPYGGWGVIVGGGAVVLVGVYG